ncbi:phage tail protein [Orrella sp. 11846]|uniref:phage tail protein n=1 Tax=Orrella sp. 11846 TaxID=3409913 RepID=UPI003B5BFD4D
MGLPQVGLAILGGVAVLGSWLLRPKLPNTHSEGPRLAELTATSSQYGIGIPRVWGTYVVPGNVLWMGKVREHAHTTSTSVRSGKGGAGSTQTHTQTTYTYSVSVAVGLARGPLEKVLKILMDGKVVFDATGATLDVTVPGLSWRFYPGNESQLPDSIIAADVGQESTPAHRGLAYVVFENLNLTPFGNRLPQMQFVVQSVGQSTTLTQGMGTKSVYSVSWSIGRYYEVADDHIVARAVQNDRIVARRPLPSGAKGQRDVVYSDQRYVAVFYSAGTNHRRLAVYDAHSLALLHDTRVLFRGNNFGDAVHLNGQRSLLCEYDSLLTGQRRLIAFVAMSDYYFIAAGTGYGGTTIVDVASGETLLYDPNVAGMRGWHSWMALISEDVGSATVAWLHTGESSTTLLLDTIEVTDEVVIDKIGGLIPTGKWRAEPTLNKVGCITVTLPMIDPEGRVQAFRDSVYGGPNYSPIDYILVDPFDKGFILSACDGVFTVKLSPSGSVLWRFCADESFTWNSIYLHRFGASYGTRLTGRTLAVRGKKDGVSGRYVLSTSTGEVLGFYPTAGSGDPTAWDSQSTVLVKGNSAYFLDRGQVSGTSVAGIIEDVSNEVGVDPGDLSGVADLSVIGYLQAKPTEARGVLEPLGSLYNFDAVEAASELKWVRRGSTPVATLHTDDLIAGSDEVLKISRTEDIALPQSVAVTYSDADMVFEMSTVYRQRYVGNEGFDTMRSRNRQSVEVPAAVHANVAKQSADALLMQAWNGRTKYKLRSPRPTLLLTPGDTITILQPDAYPVDALVESTTLGANLVLEIEAVAQDSSQYVSAVQAESGHGVVEQTLPVEMVTRLYLLPTPYLEDANDQMGTKLLLYYTMGGLTDNWRGGALDRLESDDTFKAVDSMPYSTVHGALLAPLAPATKWDVFATNEKAELHVMLLHGELETVSQAELVAGANAAAIIRNTNQAEVIQFRQAYLQEDGSYLLRGLLRGRRGTDAWAFDGTTPAGCAFVLLNEDVIGATVLPTERLGTLATYRGRGGNQLPQDGDVRFTTVAGNEYRPYAPWHVQVTHTEAGIEITWVRRTRLRGGLVAGVGDVPLLEVAEKYEIDVYADNEIVRTLVTNEPQAFYTNVMMAEDGLDAASFVVYQMSDFVGRGFPSLMVHSRAAITAAQLASFAIERIPPPRLRAAQMAVFALEGMPPPSGLAAQLSVFALQGLPAPLLEVAQASVFAVVKLPSATVHTAQTSAFAIEQLPKPALQSTQLTTFIIEKET